MVGKHPLVPVNLNPPPKRLTDKQAEQRFDPNARPTFAVAFAVTNSVAGSQNTDAATNRQIDEQLDVFLKANGALVRVNDAGREHGQIRAFNNRTFDVNKAVPDGSDAK